MILVLRLLLLRDTDSEAWRTFTSLALLLEEWKKMDPWEENQEGIVSFIQRDLGLTEFSREEILTVGGCTVTYNLLTFSLQVIAINCTNTFSKYLDPNSSPEYQDTVGEFVFFTTRNSFISTSKVPSFVSSSP